MCYETLARESVLLLQAGFSGRRSDTLGRIFSLGSCVHRFVVKAQGRRAHGLPMLQMFCCIVECGGSQLRQTRAGLDGGGLVPLKAALWVCGSHHVMSRKCAMGGRTTAWENGLLDSERDVGLTGHASHMLLGPESGPFIYSHFQGQSLRPREIQGVGWSTSTSPEAVLGFRSRSLDSKCFALDHTGPDAF